MGTLRGQQILIIDSEPAMLSSAVAVLSAKGIYQVSTAESGAAALDNISQHEYAVIIANLVLNDMSGFELVKLVTGRAPEAPVIVAGPKDTAAVLAEALGPDVFDCLIVPFNPRDLLRMTAHAASYSALLRENNRLKEEIEKLKRNVEIGGAGVREVISLKETERKLIVRTLKECQGNKHLTAKLLRIPRSTLYSKIHKHRIRIPENDAEPLQDFDRKAELFSAAADH